MPENKLKEICETNGLDLESEGFDTNPQEKNVYILLFVSVIRFIINQLVLRARIGLGALSD